MAVETHELDSFSWPKETPVGAQLAIHPFKNEVTTTQIDGDALSVLKLRKLSEGRIPVGFHFFCDDLEGATPASLIDLIISDGTTTKVLIDANNVTQAGGIINEQDAALAQLATWYMLDFIDSHTWYFALRISTAWGANPVAGTIAGYLATLGRGWNTGQ